MRPFSLHWATTEEHLNACYAVRREVFIKEQSVPEELELDSYDLSAQHLLALCDDGEPAGTARLLIDTPQPGVAKVGRVAVRSLFRGRGLATTLMQKLEEQAVRDGQSSIVLDAQTTVIPMYEKLGYHAFGPLFDDAGIEHQKMSKTL